MPDWCCAMPVKRTSAAGDLTIIVHGRGDQAHLQARSQHPARPSLDVNHHGAVLAPCLPSHGFCAILDEQGRSSPGHGGRGWS
jgi:hypothetical protein